MTSWERTPAWAVVLARLTELAARVERVRAERRRRALAGIVALAAKEDQ